MRDLVIACFSSLGPALKSGIELRHDGDAEVYVDGDRIIQVLTNLVGNAIKFSSAPGSVDVHCGPCDDHDWVRIEVVDTGRGIPAASLGRIFDRFEQVEPNDATHGGVGLGLPIAQAIVAAHGGIIEAHSTPGHGSTFTFTVPAVPVVGAGVGVGVGVGR
jgi:signal transduction histidine kinase